MQWLFYPLYNISRKTHPNYLWASPVTGFINFWSNHCILGHANGDRISPDDLKSGAFDNFQILQAGVAKNLICLPELQQFSPLNTAIIYFLFLTGRISFPLPHSGSFPLAGLQLVGLSVVLKLKFHTLIFPQFPSVLVQDFGFPTTEVSINTPLWSNSFSLIHVTLCYSVYLSFCPAPRPQLEVILLRTEMMSFVFDFQVKNTFLGTRQDLITNKMNGS